MADENKNIPSQNEKVESQADENTEDSEEAEVFTLTDETGKESDFELLLSLTIEDQTYYALTPLSEDKTDDDEEGEYVILRLSEENGEQILVTIDDDEEFDKVAAVFDDALFGDIDYDSEIESEKK